MSLKLSHTPVTAILNPGKLGENHGFPRFLGRLNYPRLAFRRVFPAEDRLSASKRNAVKDRGNAPPRTLRGPYRQILRRNDIFPSEL